MYADSYVSTPDSIPDKEHYAIFIGKSRYIEGDERSRTSPGHGYPASTEYFISYEAYFTKEKLLQAIKECEKSLYKEKYVACKITPMSVVIDVSINVKET